jgi:NAD(P)-dependent dehydrogenase (short-subunit alcohol dehydrogenase family)
MSNLHDRVYIITGGSQGFGLAIAHRLVEAGARVGLIARREERLQQAVEALGLKNAFAVKADICRSAQVKQAFAAIHGHYGRLDGLINNAGIARAGTIEETPEDELRMQIDINIVGLVLCCQAAIPLIRASNNPRIINIGSASANYREEMRHLGIYAATKMAVDRLTAEMRDELKADGIGVTLVIPGAAMTEFSVGWDQDRFTKALRTWNEHGDTMDQGMEPSDVAEAVVHCLAYKQGVAVDTLTLRPNNPVPKIKL